MRRVGLVLTLLVVFAVSVAAFPTPPGYDEYVQEVVFGTEFGVKASVMTTWDKTLRWYLEGASWDQREAVVGTLEWLDTYAVNLSIVEVSTKAAADLVVYVCPQGAYPDRAYISETGADGFTLLWTQGPRITRASVWLNSAMTAQRAQRVVREELFQALGFCGDSSKARISITSKVDVSVQEYQKLDQLVLILAYAPARPAVCTRKDFLAFSELIFANAKVRGE